jgi:hypothetical protein
MRRLYWFAAKDIGDARTKDSKAGDESKKLHIEANTYGSKGNNGGCRRSKNKKKAGDTGSRQTPRLLSRPYKPPDKPRSRLWQTSQDA